MSQSLTYIQDLLSCDFNQVVFPGKYQLVGSSTYTNAPIPSGGAGFLTTEARSRNTSLIKQTVEYRSSSTIRLFSRFGSNSSGSNPLGGSFSWGSWEELITPNNDYTTSKAITSTGTIKAGRLESTGVVTGGTVSSTGNVTATGYISSGSYTVAGLPAGVTGSIVYATNGRKSGEAAGAGTGCPVFFQGVWRTFYDNTAVQA